MKMEVVKDREQINKIIENCLPLMKMNKRMTQDCADAIIVYFVEKDIEVAKNEPSTRDNMEKEMNKDYEKEHMCQLTLTIHKHKCIQQNQKIIRFCFF